MPVLRIADVVEVCIIAFLIYHILAWVKNTRAWSLLMGVLVIAAFVILAALFNMTTILWIVRNVMGTAVIAMVVILQPELRNAIEELGQRNILSSLFLFEPDRTPEGRFSDQTITEIVTALDGFPRKPDPAAIFYLINKYSLAPTRCFYVGDRSLDIEAANSAGIRSVLYLDPSSPIKATGNETFVVSDLIEILSIISKQS